MRIKLKTSLVGASCSYKNGDIADFDDASAKRLIAAGFAVAVPVVKPPAKPQPKPAPVAPVPTPAPKVIETAAAPQGVTETASITTTPQMK